MKREVVVSSVGFSEDALELAYMVLPEDVRSEAHVVVSRSVSISFKAEGGLGGAAIDLQNSAVELAAKLHDLLDTLSVFEPPATERMTLPFADDDDDDDVGMGDGR